MRDIFPALNPELAPYLKDGKLTHPLVQFEYITPVFFARLNQLYKQRLRQEQNQYAPNEWDRFHSHLPPIDRLVKLLRSEPQDNSEYYQLVGEAWTAPELITNSSTLIPMLIDPSHSNLSSLMTSSEQEYLANLPSKMTIYRGHDATDWKGYSWTLDQKISLRWASAARTTQHITKATVRRERIIAYINRRDEDEILVSPYDLEDIITSEP